jgi:hypothetical protein
MHFRSAVRLWCFCGSVVVFSLLAHSQAGQLGAIHVDSQDSKEGVRMSLKPSTLPPPSPEAVKLLNELVAANGVDMQPTTPWHVELTYDEFDEDGDNVHSGTVEEFYVDAKKYKKIIKTDGFAQTEVADGTDLYRDGDQSWPPQSTLQALKEVLSPLYAANSRSDSVPDKLDWTVGKTALSCVVLRNGRVISENGLPKFCYEPGTTILRYTRGAGWNETVYNDLFQFEQRYVARDTEVTHAGKPFLRIHLLKVESVQQLGGSMFLPPAGSRPLSGVITVPSAVLMSEYLVNRPSLPELPRGVRGKVDVRLLVDKDGHVVRAEAIDGPKELWKPVEKYFMKLQFRSFLILDRAVEVESTTAINIQ